MQSRQHTPWTIYGLLFVTAISISGCSDFVNLFKAKPKPVAVKAIQQEEFVQNLTLASLALQKDPSTVGAAKPHVAKLNTATSIKKQKNVPLKIVAFEYKTQGKKEIKKLLAPVHASEESSFSFIGQALDELAGKQYVLQNIYTYAVTLTLPPPAKFSTTDSTVLAQQLASQQQRLLATTRAIPPYENAKLQTHLTRFFLETRRRDAAYLMLENTKNTLAFIAEKTPQIDIASLNDDTKTLEERIRSELPYEL